MLSLYWRERRLRDANEQMGSYAFEKVGKRRLYDASNFHLLVPPDFHVIPIPIFPQWKHENEGNFVTLLTLSYTVTRWNCMKNRQHS